MTTRGFPDGEGDRRQGPFDRRLQALEDNYRVIIGRLDGLDALKNQIQGMISLVKFVGWAGVASIILIAVRLLMKGL